MDLKIPLFSFLWIFIFCGKGVSQTRPAPGGVRGAIIWLATDTTAKEPTYRSVIGGMDSLYKVSRAPANQLLNFNKSLVFDGNDSLAVRLIDSTLSSSSFFTVYQSTKPEIENTVWHIVKQNQTSIVLTTKRMADLESINYMNYNDVVPKNPKINIYVQQKIKETGFPIKQSWKIGFKPLAPILPVYSFTGLIPEIIAYKRVLNSKERLKVATYLAIKYGITISDANATYLNSAGDILWNGLNYTDYFHNITGIGRDDTSGLVQPKSTSSNIPGLLTISTTKKLENNNFLLWGDNDKPLSVGNKIPGQPIILQKKWLMAAHSNGSPLTTELLIDTKQIDASLPVQPVYWLAVDRTGNDDFSAPGIEYIKMTSLDKDGNAHFQNIKWGINGGNKEIMGVFVGQDMFASTKIINPVCNIPNGGILKIKIVGGTAPFRVILTRNAITSLLDNNFNNSDTITVNNISGGKYNLIVTDANQQRFTDSFYTNNIDAPHPIAVADNYLLQQGATVTIRGDSLMSSGVIYEWNGPNNFSSNSGEVQIKQPGLYHLKCTKDGCSYQQDINVESKLVGPFTQVMVFPTPSTGQFTADVSLDNPASITMEICTIDGKPVYKQGGIGLAHYRFTGDLKMSGTYIIYFKSGGFTTSRKQVVVN